MLQGKMIGVKDLNDFYRGKIIRHLIAQEFVSMHDDSGYKPHLGTRKKTAMLR